MERELIARECQGRCAWEATDEEVYERGLFRCTGCGSEWTSAKAWTPRNWDGTIPPEVVNARRIG